MPDAAKPQFGGLVRPAPRVLKARDVAPPRTTASVANEMAANRLLTPVAGK